MDEMTFTLHNPLTEEEWDIIEDVDFDHTNSITFHTKHGKDVEFVKRKTGRWILVKGSNGKDYHKCSECLHTQEITGVKNYCAVCGTEMREDGERA